jgi:uncharacterized protein (TIGR02145 family)
MTKISTTRMIAVALTTATMALAAGCEKDNDKSLAELATTPVTYIDEQTVMCGGIITADGGATVSEKGICWGTEHNPSTGGMKLICGSDLDTFTGMLGSLTANTQYFVRAYAVNSEGTAYGQEMSFRTWNAEMVTDLDGNVYHTVTVGAQVWLVENLNVTHYRNGDPIPLIPDNPEWEGLTTGAYCDYDNDPGNAATYGRLYNWFAVADNRNIAPEGWHVSSDAEWTAMTTYLGGEEVAGGKLKEAGLTHWLEPNYGATNETGFSALPGGHREYGGNYTYMYWGGGWWTSTADNPNDAWIRYLDHGTYDVWNYLEDKRYGRSVRCVKD